MDVLVRLKLSLGFTAGMVAEPRFKASLTKAGIQEKLSFWVRFSGGKRGEDVPIFRIWPAPEKQFLIISSIKNRRPKQKNAKYAISTTYISTTY